MSNSIIAHSAAKSNGAYAIYLRKSRADFEAEQLGDGETLARHRKILTELAKRRNLNVVDTFEEIVSGESIAARDQMQQLLKNVRARKYAGVICMDIDRLGRGNTREQGIIAEAFEVTNTIIVTPGKDYNPSIEEDSSFLAVKQLFAAQEFKMIKKRLRIGKLQSVKDGNYLGANAPLGYKKTQSGKTKTLVIDEDSSETVKLIFNLCTENHFTVGQIVDRLQALGIKSPTGNERWGKTTIRKILNNIVYCGYTTWDKRKTFTEYSEDRKIKVRKEQDDYIVTKGKHEPIITEKQFRMAQGELKKHSVPVHKTAAITSPLAGIIICKKCGRAIIENKYTSVKYTKREPQLHHVPNTGCSCKSIRTSCVMQEIIVSLEKQYGELSVSSAHKTNAPSNDNALKKLSDKVNELDAKMQRLYDLLESSVYTDAEFIDRRKANQDERNRIIALLESEKAKRENNKGTEERIIKFAEVIAGLKDDSLPNADKNKFLRSIIDHVEYYREPLKSRNTPFEIDIYYR